MAMYGGRTDSTLHDLRYEIFFWSAVNTKVHLGHRLPPTEEAAAQHSYRTYHQVRYYDYPMGCNNYHGYCVIAYDSMGVESVGKFKREFIQRSESLTISRRPPMGIDASPDVPQERYRDNNMSSIIVLNRDTSLMNRQPPGTSVMFKIMRKIISTAT